MSSDKCKLPIRLKQLRNEKSISQYKLAEKLNLSRGLLSNYEQGRREPDYETLILIADFFDVSIDYLLGTTDIRKRLLKKDEENEYRKIVKNISGLSPQSIGELEQYINLLKIRDGLGEKENAKSSALEKRGC